VQLDRDRLEVADRQSAAAQHRGGLHPPVVEQQLHASYDVEGGARGAAGHEGGVARGRRQAGHVVHRVGGRAPTAQGQPDLARQHHGVALPRHQQAPADELLGGAACLRRRDRTARGAGRALAAVLVDVAQQRGRRRRQLGDPCGQVGGARGLRAGGPQPAGEARHPAHRVGDAGQRAHAARGLPRQRQVEQALEGGPRRVRLGVDDRDQRLGSGLTCNQQGIKDGKFQAVQAVEGTVDRRTRGGPRGQL
jgi:hypothetical protein